jgi:hypothetical protein
MYKIHVQNFHLQNRSSTYKGIMVSNRDGFTGGGEGCGVAGGGAIFYDKAKKTK